MTRRVTNLDKWAHKATVWIGTTQSIVLHTIIFLITFILVPILGFDRVMLIVTTAVSLEAIYLSLFIQLTVNNSNKHLKEILEDTEELTEEETD